METACPKPEGFCGNPGDKYRLVDCDGDVVLDHVCEDSITGENSAIRSQGGCQWVDVSNTACNGYTGNPAPSFGMSYWPRMWVPPPDATTGAPQACGSDTEQKVNIVPYFLGNSDGLTLSWVDGVTATDSATRMLAFSTPSPTPYPGAETS